MELLILDPAVSVLVKRYRSDISGIQAHQDNKAMRHHASQQFAMRKLNCVIILYNKTMLYDLGFISFYEGICIIIDKWGYMRVGVFCIGSCPTDCLQCVYVWVGFSRGGYVLEPFYLHNTEAGNASFRGHLL